MLRLISTLVLGIALGYCAFFVRLEGKTVASHLADVWSSPVVQQKIRIVEREVPRAIKGSLPKNLPVAAPDLAPYPEPDAAAQEGHSQRDRHALDAMVHRAQGGHAAKSPKRDRTAK